MIITLKENDHKFTLGTLLDYTIITHGCCHVTITFYYQKKKKCNYYIPQVF